MNEREEINELAALLRSRVPLVLVETHEEPRVLKLLSQACNFENQLMMRWSIVDGLGRVHGTGGGMAAASAGPRQAVRCVGCHPLPGPTHPVVSRP